jgi:hypothetical protein
LVRGKSSRRRSVAVPAFRLPRLAVNTPLAASPFEAETNRT